MGYNTLANIRKPVPSTLECYCLETDTLLPLSGKPCPIWPPAFELSGIYPSNKLNSGDISSRFQTCLQVVLYGLLSALTARWAPVHPAYNHLRLSVFFVVFLFFSYFIIHSKYSSYLLSKWSMNKIIRMGTQTTQKNNKNQNKGNWSQEIYSQKKKRIGFKFDTMNSNSE